MIRSVLFAMSMSLMATSAFAVDAEDIALINDGNSPEREIVEAMFPQYEPGSVRILTGRTNINGDDTAEIVAKFDSRGTCRSNRSCLTALIAYSEGQWNTVFQQYSRTLGLGEPDASGMHTLVADGDEVWTWGKYGYAPSIARMGEPVVFVDATPEVAAQLAPAMGEEILSLVQSGAGKIAVSKSQVLSSKEEELIAKYVGNCDPETGCPFVVLSLQNRQYETILSGFTTQDVVLLPYQNFGGADIAVDQQFGYSRFRFNGKTYLPNVNVDIRTLLYGEAQ